MARNKLMRGGLLLALILAVIFVAPLSAAQAAKANLQATEPITRYAAETDDYATFDPQRGEDNVSINPIENLFVGLTDIDPKTQEVRPALATKWTMNDAGDVWTFTLRNDVPWINYDPATKKISQLGMVTAGDVVYGIKRECDPRLGAYYTGIVAAMIKGCDVVSKIAPDAIKPSDFDQVGVKALSDTQLEIDLQGDLPYFKAASTLWVLYPTPQKTIEQYGEDWILPGNIVTDGPFMLESWNKGVSSSFLRNPNFPKDFHNTYGGNIERRSVILVKDANTIYSLFQNGTIDSGPIPRGEQQKILADPVMSKQVIRSYDLSVSYIGFAYDKPPFDNVHVRRAFSAMLDRKTMVTDLLGGRGAPMAHFMPPGIFGSVGINEVGLGDSKNLGFDPEYAKSEFAAAGYSDCSSFPTVTILTSGTNLAEFLQNAAKQYLGCDPSKINIQQAEFQVLIQGIKPNVPTPQRPNMWDLAWGPDYLDAQDWIYAVLSCKSENDAKRPCGDIDKKIDEAGAETDSKKRAQDYRDLEQAFFGKDGEFMVAPLFTGLNVSLVKPWFHGLFETDGLLGGSHWDSYNIDQTQQLAARGGANVPLIPPTDDPNATPGAQ